MRNFFADFVPDDYSNFLMMHSKRRARVGWKRGFLRRTISRRQSEGKLKMGKGKTEIEFSHGPAATGASTAG
jgi:hypothetical protein